MSDRIFDRCPYCGAFEDHMQVLADGYGATRQYAVECMTCGMRGPNKFSTASAINAWNRLRRTADDEKLPSETDDAEDLA